METKVTQLHWAQVMGDNPSHFANGPQSIEIEINYRKFRINPDHPVEMISWWSALVFANELSKRHGLKPAYDLSGIEFEDGSLKGNRTMLAADEILRVAAKGSLNARYCFSAPKINAPEENIYDTEGYRFPTYAEQLYFLSNAGTANGKYYFGDDSKQLKNHAWYFEIAGGQTHPVGALLPMRIGTGVFYDVLGNVDEWAYDEEDEMSGANPIGRTLGAAVTGGSHHSFRFQLGQLEVSKDPMSHNGVSPAIGLRLVRTLKPGIPIIERGRTQ
jgi:formylglycine-generating enzyme required for sulfatase activity